MAVGSLGGGGDGTGTKKQRAARRSSKISQGHAMFRNFTFLSPERKEQLKKDERRARLQALKEKGEEDERLRRKRQDGSAVTGASTFTPILGSAKKHPSGSPVFS